MSTPEIVDRVCDIWDMISACRPADTGNRYLIGIASEEIETLLNELAANLPQD